MFTKTVDNNEGEEIIFIGFDEGWGRELPVKLITYPDGSMDLHRQTGSRFKEHTEKALEILKSRGIVLDKAKTNAMGSSGYYQPLKLDTHPEDLG